MGNDLERHTRESQANEQGQSGDDGHVAQELMANGKQKTGPSGSQAGCEPRKDRVWVILHQVQATVTPELLEHGWSNEKAVRVR